MSELLRRGADADLPLTHGIGSALCQACSIQFETRRTLDGRIALVDLLLASGADVLALYPLGPKKVMGTAVDYAHLVYNQDKRIAHTPFHSLTTSERQTFVERQQFLAHIANLLREKAVRRERARLDTWRAQGIRSMCPIHVHSHVESNGRMLCSV